jgi:hypothetical protein
MVYGLSVDSALSERLKLDGLYRNFVMCTGNFDSVDNKWIIGFAGNAGSF